MYELHVEAGFSAAHAITIAGRREPLHGHDWCARVIVQGDHLDDDGLLCDFHLIESRLRDALGPLHNTTLNAASPFDTLSPTAEHVARHIAQTLSAMLDGELPAGVELTSVEVTEAPGCSAVFKFPEKKE